jgi:hypothetical protein
MTNQKPKGMPEEMKKAPIGEEPGLEELQPVVDRSATPHPVKKRRAWYRRTYKSSIGPLL